jgi:hypothetical protein
MFGFTMPSALLCPAPFCTPDVLVAWLSCLPCRTWCNIIIINYIVCLLALALAAATHVSTAHATFVPCGQRSFCQETAPIAHFCQPVVAKIALFLKRKAQFWGQNSALSGQPKPRGTTLIGLTVLLMAQQFQQQLLTSAQHS